MNNLLLVLSVFGAFAQTQPRPNWDATLSRAIQLRAAGSADAAGVFSEAVAQSKEIEDGGLALAQVLSEFAVDHQNHGRYAEAKLLYGRVLAIYEANPRRLPLDVAATKQNLAITCRALGRRDDAESLYRSSIDIIEQAAGPHHEMLLYPLTFLGALYIEAGRIAEAEPFLTRALRIGREVLGPNHQDLVITLNTISAMRRLRGDFDGGRRSATRALRILESTSGLEDLRAVGTLYELGLLEFETGRLRKAAAHWECALAIIEKHRPPDHAEALNILIQLGDIAALERRSKEAETLFLRVAHAAERPGGAALQAVSLHHLAVLYAGRNQHERAEPFFRRSLALTEAAVGKRNTQWASCAADLGRTLFSLKRIDDAEAMTRTAVAIAEQTSGLQHPAFLRVLQDHARMLKKLGRKEEARQVENRMRSIAPAAESSLHHTVSLAELKSRR
jgi:tetratricopeptide (TPR) repeat protein